MSHVYWFSLFCCCSLSFPFSFDFLWDYLFLLVWGGEKDDWSVPFNTSCRAVSLNEYCFDLVLLCNVFLFHLFCSNVLLGKVVWVGICGLLELTVHLGSSSIYSLNWKVRLYSNNSVFICYLIFFLSALNILYFSVYLVFWLLWAMESFFFGLVYLVFCIFLVSW